MAPFLHQLSVLVELFLCSQTLGSWHEVLGALQEFWLGTGHRWAPHVNRSPLSTRPPPLG